MAPRFGTRGLHHGHPETVIQDWCFCDAALGQHHAHPLVVFGGRLVTQTTLLQKIWGQIHVKDTQYLRKFLLKLRQKLQDDAANPRYLETEPGIGYRFIPTQQ